ncbi:hypothetical protein [Microcoleus sp. Pol1C5]|uniref:hypothetical protein n=1 Tax=Microcoleus sp. Pol1C5 TaxID=3055406 RepID=UPI00403F05C2
MRHSYDRGGDKKAIHMVSAWATSQRLVLGQVKVDKKSNKITAPSGFTQSIRIEWKHCQH